MLNVGGADKLHLLNNWMSVMLFVPVTVIEFQVRSTSRENYTVYLIVRVYLMFLSIHSEICFHLEL